MQFHICSHFKYHCLLFPLWINKAAANLYWIVFAAVVVRSCTTCCVFVLKKSNFVFVHMQQIAKDIEEKKNCCMNGEADADPKNSGSQGRVELELGEMNPALTSA